jgi:hypothetical protein
MTLLFFTRNTMDLLLKLYVQEGMIMSFGKTDVRSTQKVIGRTFISFSWTMDEEKFFMVFFINVMYFGWL